MSKRLLHEIFDELAEGNSDIVPVLQELADTAVMIDPACPYGAHGILESICTYKFGSMRLAHFFNLTGNNPLLINAIDYAVFKGALEVKDLRHAVDTNFERFGDNDAPFNPYVWLQFALDDQPTFGLNYVNSL